ncbi:MAG: hydroxymethylbilane synthase [Deferribacteraceae bacterium]|jgi:hydroxymethylbilane synthase|nr:hydroxymethylbilane synthase [Deferribacteraceae bacterium]
MTKLVIATRGSQLALWQANHIKTLIEAEHGVTCEIKIVKTRGDIYQDVPLAAMGGKGVFVKEIEERLLSSDVDLAVHSMKDVPAFIPSELEIYANPKKEVSCDAFLSVKYGSIPELTEGAVVGTSSLRRKIQLKRVAPQVVINDLRGNIDTRIRKLENGDYDAIILAEAGLRRLGLTKYIKQSIPSELILPAACQGVLGIEVRKEDASVKSYLNFLKDEKTEVLVRAERAFLIRLDCGCYAPAACHAEFLESGLISVRGFLSDLQGNRFIKTQLQGEPEYATSLGDKLAAEILAAGGGNILKDLKELQ